MTMRIPPRNTALGVLSGIGSEIRLRIFSGLCTAMAEAALVAALMLSSCWESWDALWALLVLPIIRFSTSPSKMFPLQETSSAQYIVQQYMATTGCLRFQNSIKSSYIVGRVKMVSTESEIATKPSRNYSVKASETGCFLLWQMMPDMWSMELVLGGSKVHAGSNGNVTWRHTPWLGSHAAKGRPRPLRRALQGLDPRTTAIMFSNARCFGEKKFGDEDCFILKLAADPSTLHERSDGPAEVIRHGLFGYFSKKNGLLVYLEDSHLTRIQATGMGVIYWETTIETTINNYKTVDGVMIAHSGRSVVTLSTFGECSMSHTRTRMEETWTIDDVVFNMPGLSMDCFIPPADIIKSGSGGEAYNYQSD